MAWKISKAGKSRTDWTRVPNTGPGQRVGNKYNLTKYLKKEGDYVITNPATKAEIMKLKYAAYIWARRHKCRVRTSWIYHPNDMYAMEIMLVSATRRYKA